MPESIEKKLVCHSVYEQLRTDIITGKLAPGAKLKLNRLKVQYDTSVNTLRESLVRLVSEGFVRFIDQKGFSVQMVSKDDLNELLELRIILETRGLEKSMINQSGLLAWKSELVAAHYRLTCIEELLLNDWHTHMQAWLIADRDFHKTMVANCGSNQIIRYHASISEQFMRYQLIVLQRQSFRSHESYAEHKQLLERILQDDVPGGLTILQHHITQDGK